MAKINQQNYITTKHTEVKMNELIKEAAERLYPGVDRQVDRMLFIAGAKWYREQLILKLKEGQDE